MKKLIFILFLTTLSFSQNEKTKEEKPFDIKAFYKQMALRTYTSQGLTIDSTRYSLEEKSKRIDDYHLNSDFTKLAELFFFDSDTMLQDSQIKKWIMGLYFEQLYDLIGMTFGQYYPENYHVIMSKYKSRKYRGFLQGLTHLKNINLSTHLAKLDALFKLKRYDEIVKDTLYLNREKIPLLLSELHIRANYKVENFDRITHFFKDLSNDDLTAETIFIAAKAYLSLKQYDIADYFFNLYIKNAKNTEIKEFQLAHYYRGLSYQERDQIKTAEEFYKKAIDYNPEYLNLKAFIHQTLGGYYQEKKMYKKALDEWISYLALLPESHSNREATRERIEILREKAFLHSDAKEAKKKSN